MGALLGLLQFIPNLFGTINSITAAIANEKIAGINATTEQDKINSSERVATLQARRDVMVATASTHWDTILRALFALPFVIYNFKLVVWDKVLGLGSTEGLSSELAQIEMICISFYFLYEGASLGARVIASRK